MIAYKMNINQFTALRRDDMLIRVTTRYLVPGTRLLPVVFMGLDSSDSQSLPSTVRPFYVTILDEGTWIKYTIHNS